MKIAAIGDAHLGRTYLPITDADTGVNRRELDFEQSFSRAVDAALAEEPDVLLWLGDVFDHPRPTYRAFRVAARELRKVREHGVQLVAISGNHDTPRLPGTGSPYSVLADTFPELHFAARLQYEAFDIGGLRVHCVPQMLTVPAALDALAAADANRSADRSNLLITHPRLTQLRPKYDDINEIEVDVSALQSDFVLLGHYHVHQKVDDRVWYAGAPDTFTFADDPDRPKGIVVLDTDTGALRHIPVPGQRRLVTLETVQALGLSPSEVRERVLERAAQVQEGDVARLFIEDVEPTAYKLLDLHEVREVAGAALHLKLEPKLMRTTTTNALPDLESMGARWDAFVAEADMIGYDRPKVAALGHQYLSQAVEEASG
jgi:DNA repair exonuclease SbcCD nuclease subunit